MSAPLVNARVSISDSKASGVSGGKRDDEALMDKSSAAASRRTLGQAGRQHARQRAALPRNLCQAQAEELAVRLLDQRGVLGDAWAAQGAAASRTLALRHSRAARPHEWPRLAWCQWHVGLRLCRRPRAFDCHDFA